MGFWVLLGKRSRPISADPPGLLYQIALAIVFGTVFGLLANRALRLAHQHAWMDRESLVAFELVLSLVVDQTAAMAGLDDLLATFCAGAAFGWDGEHALAIEGSNWSQTLDMLVNWSCFAFIGATVPFYAFVDPNLNLGLGRLFAVVVTVLLLNRMPIILALKPFTPALKNWREAAFVGPSHGY